MMRLAVTFLVAAAIAAAATYDVTGAWHLAHLHAPRAPAAAAARVTVT
jgi:hypothetical protein